MRTPQQERSQLSTKRMLDAGLQLIAEGGLSAVTVAAVAEKAGSNNGSIYHRFRSAKKLVIAIQDSFLGEAELRITNGLPLDPPLDPQQAALIATRLYLSEFGDNAALYRAFLVEGFDRLELRDRGLACSQASERATVKFFTTHTGCSAEAATKAFYLLFSLGNTRATWGTIAVTAAAPSDEDWERTLPGALLALIGANPQTSSRGNVIEEG